MSRAFTKGDGEGVRSGPVSEQFDWAETAPSMAVVEVIAAAAGTEPTVGTPIYESVEAGAIDALFRAGNDSSDRQFSFTHEGIAVTVKGDGTVLARPTLETASR
ncbi:HalOD1 output domain-containing protein [Haloarcula amylovorans]|uniref:HalOD1 output domain-containing protein n=1 Tax=Haloarcula amylovorans TaxID=2562280 RepID=UPI0010765CB2|nr:HalOD1 output domain-containing protein [Halomicroarcula amylolytica]